MDQILVSVCCPPQNEHIDIKKVANNSNNSVNLPSSNYCAMLFIYAYLLPPAIFISNVRIGLTQKNALTHYSHRGRGGAFFTRHTYSNLSK